MRSRAELALRITALIALAAWIALAARPSANRREDASGAGLSAALQRWTRDADVDSVRVRLDTVPDAPSLAWLAALRGAGVGVAWSALSVTDIAIETYAAADPAGGVFVLASTQPRATRIVSDALGPLDTLGAAAGAVRLASVEGEIAVTAGAQSARGAPSSPPAAQRVFVAGAAGWESKFIIAALEEHGWIVDAHLLVAPGRDVYQGPSSSARAALDTSRYSAVVLVDSAAAEATGNLELFARRGGGVVLAGDATRARNARGLATWYAGSRETAPLGTLPADTTWRGLSRWPLALTADHGALVLESRNGRPVVIARRHYAGRVIAVGYDQTWRWRMSGGDTSRVEHRDWWSRVVASVAKRPVPVDSGDTRTGDAPLASLYAILGPPSAATRALPAGLSLSLLSHLLGVVCLAALLAEWLLRRSRGAR